MANRSATTADVAASATSVALFTADADRSATGRTVFNDSSAVLYLKFGTAATTTSYTVQIPPGGYFEFPRPIYDGVVHGVWSAATGSARVTEVN